MTMMAASAEFSRVAKRCGSLALRLERSHTARRCSPLGQTAIPPCVVRPEQTEGPYSVDQQINRSDIRVEPTTGVAKPGDDYVQDDIPQVVIEAGSRMKPGKPHGRVARTDFMVPPIGVSFEEAVTKLMRVQPPKRTR